MKISKLNLTDIEKSGQEKENVIRDFREPLLVAYDSYKASVAYKEIEETPEEREIVLKWIKKIRDKDVTALEEIPEKIKYYL